MEQSLLDYMKDSEWQRGKTPEQRPAPPFELPYPADAELIELKEPDLLPDAQVNFLEMIELRATQRQYDESEALTNKELSYLLWCSQGVKMATPAKTIRNVPSAGGRNALETYLYLRRVEGIEEGLYRFLPLEHKLLKIKTISEDAELSDNICGQFSTIGVTKKAAVVFLWAAVYERMACKFGARAYRYIHLDAGHACQNLYLAAQTQQIKVCALGAYDDEALNTNLGFDGVNQFVVYAAGVGK